MKRPVTDWRSGRQYERPFELSLSQAGEGGIGIFQSKTGDMGANGGMTKFGEERLAVLAGQIGHRTQYSFTPQQLIGKSRNIAHMNAGADHTAALDRRGKGQRYQRSDGGEYQRGVQRLRWQLF